MRLISSNYLKYSKKGKIQMILNDIRVRHLTMCQRADCLPKRIDPRQCASKDTKSQR